MVDGSAFYYSSCSHLQVQQDPQTYQLARQILKWSRNPEPHQVCFAAGAELGNGQGILHASTGVH